jgi:hypothetical protein
MSPGVSVFWETVKAERKTTALRGDGKRIGRVHGGDFKIDVVLENADEFHIGPVHGNMGRQFPPSRFRSP